jgi:hypothetical protein
MCINIAFALQSMAAAGETCFDYERDVQPRPRVIRMFEELRGHGYEGGYDAVRPALWIHGRKPWARGATPLTKHQDREWARWE